MKYLTKFNERFNRNELPEDMDKYKVDKDFILVNEANKYNL